jgi:hypothetical protein
MSKFKEITNEGFTQKNGSHYVRDLEFREPTKDLPKPIFIAKFS